MSVTLFGIVTDVSPEQSRNTSLQMRVTLFGIVIDVRPERPQNAPLPMLVTLSGIVVLLLPTISVLLEVLTIALQLSRESNTGLFGSTEIDISLSQAANAVSSTFVTLSGMVIDVSMPHDENAYIPMLVTLFGIVIDVNPLQ